MFEGLRKKAKGLYSPYTRDRRKMDRKSQGLRNREGEHFADIAKPSWNHYDSPPDDQFLKMGDGLEGFGDLMSFHNLKDWVRLQRESGKKVASIDVFGQPGLGLAAGVDKAIGWSLHEARPYEVRGRDSREKMMVGSVFDIASKKKVFQELDATEAQGVKLGLVFFRPWSGVNEFQSSRYAHLYLYEFILRPLYERLEVGGMMLLASQNLAGMHILMDFLAKTGEVEVKTNETRQSYLIRKKSGVPTLKSLADMGDLRAEEREFLASEIENTLPRLVRWARRYAIGDIRRYLERRNMAK